MKVKSNLARNLYTVSTIAFGLALLFIVQIVYCDLFTEPTESFKSVPHHNYGYAVPVSVHFNEQAGRLQIHGNSRIENDAFDNIFIPHGNGFVVLNPKHTGSKIVLAVKNYLFPLMLLYILWLVRSFFKQLSKEFTFSEGASKKLLHIGYAILGYQFINAALCLAILNVYGLIQVVSTDGKATPLYNFNPDVEFDFRMLLLSLSLILMSRLFNHGYQLQEENNLTI